MFHHCTDVSENNAYKFLVQTQKVGLPLAAQGSVLQKVMTIFEQSEYESNLVFCPSQQLMADIFGE